MSSTVPWKELALVGITTLGVCCLIGWATGAENLNQKKKKRGGGPAGANVEAQEIEALMQMAETAMKKGLYQETEKAYLRVLDIAANSDNPEFQMVPSFMARRLADLYEKMGNWDKCFKFNEIVLEVITNKGDPSPEDLQSQLIMIEHIVELVMAHPQHTTPAVKEKFLLIWQEIASKLHHAEHIVLSSLLLGRLKMEQEKYTESEVFLRRAASVYTDNSQREELWLSVKTAHLESLTKLENHEAAKKCILEISDFLLNFENPGRRMGNLTHEMLLSYGDRCVFLGYMDEAEHILKSTHAMMKRKGLPATELAPVDHSLAIMYSATGRLPLAREKIQEMKEYLRTGMGSSIFPSYSKYLHTQAVKHDTEGTTIVLYRVNTPAQTLKPGSVLVVKFENPEVEGEVAEIEHVVQEKEPLIRITGPFNYSNYIGQIFSAEITIYSDAEKTNVLGTHFVFIPSTTTPTSALGGDQPLSLAQEAIIERLMAAGVRPDQLPKEEVRALEELLLSMGSQGPSLEGEEEGEEGFVGEGRVWEEDDEIDGDDDEDDEEDDEERLVLNK